MIVGILTSRKNDIWRDVNASKISEILGPLRASKYRAPGHTLIRVSFKSIFVYLIFCI
jgi:hypothetical protein